VEGLLRVYFDGRPYRPPRSRFEPPAGPAAAQATALAIDLNQVTPDWPTFWRAVQRQLTGHRFRRSTLTVYRQILRAFRTFLDRRHRRPSHPGLATREDARSFFALLADQHASWSWLAANICVLRTAFDKLGGRALTARIRTPKRGRRLGDILAPAEANQMIHAARTVRDRLLITLMYGCGLKTGETCRLRWRDIDTEQRELNIRFHGDTQTRTIRIPDALLPVLDAGIRQCEPNAFVFPGAKPDTHLTARTVERIVRRAARDAEILKDVSCTTLRDSYAVARLRAGCHIRELQETLGHKKIESTLRYQAYLPPAGYVSPIDLPEMSAAAETTDRVEEQDAQPTAQDLAERLPSLPANELQLPFKPPAGRAREFYLALKTQLKKRFLALRRGASPSCPP